MKRIPTYEAMHRPNMRHDGESREQFRTLPWEPQLSLPEVVLIYNHMNPWDDVPLTRSHASKILMRAHDKIRAALLGIEYVPRARKYGREYMRRKRKAAKR